MNARADQNLMDALLAFRARFGHPAPGTSVLVAVSGGADSLALLALLAQHAGQLQLTVEAATVDHGARPFSQETQALAQWCADQQVPWTLVTLPPGLEQRAAAAGTSFEAQARCERYDALEALRSARGLRYLATAHHRSDQAETLLLRLMRGAGPGGLAGIRPVLDDRILRPLLFAQRMDLRQYAFDRNLPVVEDPTNRSPAHRRNQVRHSLLPAMEGIFPGVTGVLARGASLFRGHDLLADRLLAISQRASFCAGVLTFDRGPGPEGFQREELLALLHRALWACHLGEGLDHGHLCDLLDLGRGQALDLPLGLRAECSGPRLYVFRGNSRLVPPAPFSLELPSPQHQLETVLGRLTCTPFASLPSALDGQRRVVFDAASLAFPLRLRGCLKGELFQPWGAHAPKDCAEVLADAGIPRGLRDRPLLLEDARGTQLWLLGCRRSRFLPVPEGAPDLLSLELSPVPPSIPPQAKA
jgi:tRNA(Ile)-lysidine synthase